ncbi:MAG: DinB family protein [Planctomycetota bacterium]|jgi:uncharacterized damage-inducible protein DinB
MRIVDAFLLSLDNAWKHDWESLMSVLSGVTEEEARWQAACYADAAAPESAPPPGTIRWQVTHLAHYKREYTARLLGDREAQSLELPENSTATYEQDLAYLRRAHLAERAAIAALSDEDLTPDLADFLTNIIRHDIWHGGQIALARRLYRGRGSG